jgi:predicted dinucleotide-binding enzyme
MPGNCQAFARQVTIHFKHLHERGTSEKDKPISTFVAGDDEEAKEIFNSTAQ